jgi:hypothetical protein
MADHDRQQTGVLYIRCEPGLPDALREAAESDGRSLGDWVRRALRGCVGLPVSGPPSEKTTAKTGRSTNNRRAGIDRGKRRA